MAPRRFPPPWSVEVTPNCFIVRDANDQTLLTEAKLMGVRLSTIGQGDHELGSA